MHIISLAQFSDAEYDDFAALLKMLLMKLGSLNASYNFFLHYSPSDFHFHIELAPRLATWAGFELCTDIVINSVSPESAAEFYRR